ncbi:MAG: hypothetical protein WCP89_01685 [archaeon]
MVASVLGLIASFLIWFVKEFRKPIGDTSYFPTTIKETAPNEIKSVPDEARFSMDDVYDENGEMTVYHRMKNLLDETQSQGGQEWETLNVSDLLSICLLGIEEEQRLRGETLESLLVKASQRCVEISSWALDNPGVCAYEFFLINKSAEVGEALRAKAFDQP